MGDDLSRKEREAVRAPMQWSRDRLGGFSNADPERLAAMPIKDGPFGFHRVNVEDQCRDPDSLLHWMRRLIQIRKACPEISLGRGAVARTDTPNVFAYLYQADRRTLVTVHNLSGTPRQATIGEDLRGTPEILLAAAGCCPSRSGPASVSLAPFGYLWYALPRS
jgi:maltose alpha-D-glucosyltransferase/alpha-amylase